MTFLQTVGPALAQLDQIARSRPLWPGWDPTRTPLALHATQEVTYLVGHPAPPPGYEPVPSGLSRPVHAGRPLPGLQANTAHDYAGHLCAHVNLAYAPESDPAAFAHLILHECFHVYQATDLPQADRPDFRLSARYPESDPVNNAMAVVENRLLAPGLEGDPGAAPRFIAVREARHARLSAQGLDHICAYEQYSEYNEGTPTYIEVQAGMAPTSLTGPLGEANIGGKWASYQRFYYTGAAIAFLLDRLAPGWHHRLAQGGQTLQSLLSMAVGEPLPPVEQVLAEREYPSLLQAEEERERERRAKVAALLAEIEHGPGVRVEVLLPPSGSTGFDPRNILTVEPGRRLHTRFFEFQAPGGAGVRVERLCLEDVGERRIHLRLPAMPPIDAIRVAGEGFLLTGPRGSFRATETADRITLTIEHEDTMMNETGL